MMHFDTGSSSSNMSNIYFAKNKNVIENTAIKDSIKLAGYGGISRHSGYKIPKLGFTLGETSFEMEYIPVHTSDVLIQWNESGCLGADFVLKFDKVTVSYKNMFIEVE